MTVGISPLSFSSLSLQRVLKLRKNTCSCFEGLHAFSHIPFCSAVLWFGFSESLANLGGLHVGYWDLTQPRPRARITSASAQQSLWQPLFTDYIQEMEREGTKDQRTAACADDIPRPHSAQLCLLGSLAHSPYNLYV